MNIASQFLTALGAEADDVEVVDERSFAAKSREAHLVGLGRVKFPTAGQERRAQRRRALSGDRKQHRRNVRDLFKNRNARATLRGQLEVLAKTSPIGQAYLDNHLTQRYGSVDAAIAHAIKIGIEVPQGAVDYAASQGTA
jgi:hypothetical protein